jgi:hypothetical protein
MEMNMTKLMSILAAGAVALSLGGASFAADEKTQNQTNAPRTQDQTGVPADQSKQDQEYLVALKKCDGMQDAAKQKCIDQAKQKYNRM